MKKFFSLVVLLTTLTLSANAQLISLLAGAIKKAVPVYVHGYITFKDGHEEQYEWVELPKSGHKEIKVSNDAKHKKPTDISAEDIFSVTYWTSTFPENKITIYKLYADKSNVPFTGTLPHDVWGYPIASSNWGVVFKCNTSYEWDKKKDVIYGGYDTRAVQMGNMVRYEEVAACCYLLCKDFENAQLIGSSYSRDKSEMSWVGRMKHIAPIFASNPDMQKRIEDEKFSGRDIQVILDEMAAYHNPKGNIESAAVEANESTGTTINGTVGDDE